MTSILIKILSWWIPKRRYSLWHCSVLELLVAAWLFMFLPTLLRPVLYPTPATPEEQSQLNIPQTFPTNIFDNGKPSNEHPILRLVQTRNWTIIGLSFYMACILAPINEELLFRAGLQNCLQGIMTKFFHKQHNISVQTRRWSIAIISIVLPALFFSLIHYRSEDVAHATIEDITRSVIVCSIAWSMFTVICFTYVFHVRRLRLRDLFGTWKEAFKLALFGVKWIWIIIPTYVLTVILLVIRFITQTHFLPDPFCLIPLALVFGFLYYRTQSILPSIVLHFLFNLNSLCMAILSLFL